MREFERGKGLRGDEEAGGGSEEGRGRKRVVVEEKEIGRKRVRRA